MRSAINSDNFHFIGGFMLLTKKTRQSIYTTLTCILFALVASLLPAKPAQASDASDAIEALKTVCSKAQGLCGPGYIDIVEGCFKGSDEIKCAMAIVNVSMGGKVSEAKGQIDAVISCINDGLPIKETCNAYLKAAGVSGAQINEAYALVKQCSSINDVDDAIVCADALLDSSIAEDADLGIPSWVDSMFDVYVDIREKDYWGLVYHVGATIACAVANYFTGVDVCAFLADLAEIAGDVVDGAKEVAGALNNAGEKIFTNQTQHVPVIQFFMEYWLPDVDTYARNIVVQKNSNYWSANVGTKHLHCKNYFDSHTMSSDKANRACNDMRDGTAVSDNSFIDKGFSQLASRRGAVMLLPAMVRTAAIARMNQLRAQGIFKSPALPANMVAVDPWHGAPEVPGVETLVYRLYGLSDQGAIADSAFNREAKTVNEAWRLKSVGYVAYLTISSAKVAPATLDFPTSEAMAKTALTTGEAAIDFAGEVKNFIQKAQAERLKNAEQFVTLNKGLQESREKPLNDMLALCGPKSLVSCEREVRERFAVCDAKAKAYYDANSSVMGDFDSSQGKAAYKQWIEITRTCEAAIKQYVDALPNGSKAKTMGDIGASGVDTSMSAAQKNVMNSHNIAANNSPPSGGNHAGTSGNLSDALKRNGNNMQGSLSSNVAANSPLSSMSGTQNGATSGAYGQAGAVKNSGLGLSAPINSTPDDAALAQCKSFLGRKDELLCTNAKAFNACKVQVDSNKMRVCRIVGSQEAYPALRPR